MLGSPVRLNRWALFAFAPIPLYEIILSCKDRVDQSSVFQIVNALSNQAHHVRQGINLRAGDASQIRIKALHARRHLIIGKHQVCIHALEHVLCGRANVFVGQVDLFDDSGQVGEAAAVVGSQDAFVGDVQPLENIHHVVPALKRQ